MKLKKIAAAVLAAAVLATTPAAGALLSPFSVTANAEDILTEGDYSYTVNEDGETVTITDYSGTDTEVVIPSVLGGKTVTEIRHRIFCYCSPTSVTIPDSVTTMEWSVFSGCTSLESISVEKNNQSYSSVNGVLFNKDKSEFVCYPAGKNDKSYIIPNGVTTIGDWAFDDCTSLASITIPDSVTTIGGYAFKGCTSLSSVTIPNSVTTIGDYAFLGCTSLEAVLYYNGTKAEWESITKGGHLDANIICTDGIVEEYDYSDYQFTVNEDGVTVTLTRYDNYHAGMTVNIPATFGGKTVTGIDENAFINMKVGGLLPIGSVTIPDSVTTINNAFNGGESLETIIVGENNADYSSINGVLFNKDKSTLMCYPAGKKDASYIVPDSVTTLGDTAFSSCYSLTNVTLSNSVTTIGDYAFYDCTFLETVYYGGTQAEWDAIEKGGGNKCLTDAEIICTDGIINEREPDTSEPTSSDTSEPTSSEPENLQPGDYFVDGNLEYTVLKDGTLEIRGFAGDETKEIVIPETVKGKKVTSIGDAAFMDCTSLTSVTIPDSVTKIGGYAFSGCTSLETVNYSGRKSDWEAIEIDIENEPLTNAEIKFAEQTVEIVDEDTGVKTEVSTEDENLDGAEFEANPADHPTLWDLIKKIIEKAVDTIESVTEEAQKSLEEAAEAVKNGKGFAYDMGFKKNGKEVQPDKSVTVTVPVPDKFKNDIDKLNVYHLTNRGAVYVPSWIKDSSIMFRTNSFSPYVITTDKLEYAVADENTTVTPGDTDTANSGGSESGSDQKSTGIALAIAPVVLAVGMAIVALSKKKK